MDFDLIAHQQFIDISAVLYQATHKSYATIVAIYVARECFVGNPLTPEGFRFFVVQTLLSEYLDGVSLETVLSQELIGKMVALRGKDVEGSCMEPYLNPKSGAEAALGQALVHPPGRVTPPTRSALEAVYRGHTTEWFRQPAQSREPFVPWLWDLSRAAENTELTVPQSIAVPGGSINLPATWAIEYGLGIQQALEAGG